MKELLLETSPQLDLQVAHVDVGNWVKNTSPLVSVSDV